MQPNRFGTEFIEHDKEKISKRLEIVGNYQKKVPLPPTRSTMNNSCNWIRKKEKDLKKKKKKIEKDEKERNESAIVFHLLALLLRIVHSAQLTLYEHNF